MLTKDSVLVQTYVKQLEEDSVCKSYNLDGGEDNLEVCLGAVVWEEEALPNGEIVEYGECRECGAMKVRG